MNEAFSPAFDELRAGVESSTYVAIFYDEYALFDCVLRSDSGSLFPFCWTEGVEKPHVTSLC